MISKRKYDIKILRDASPENLIIGKERKQINEVIWFSKYRVLSELGRGNSSIVYLAEHLKLGGYCAIKCIHKDYETRPQLMQEAKLLKNLNHPGIPIVYDMEEDNENIYMIEEYIQGESLGEFIRHQKFVPETFICEKGIEICKIISYLHHVPDGPVIYRDLKPEHIILCEDKIMLLDFGIAEKENETGTNSEFFGTPEFTDENPESGHSTMGDIYSIGKVLLYLMEHSECRISENLKYIGEKAAYQETEKRFMTVEDLQSALQHHLDHVHQKQNQQNQKHLLTFGVIGSERHIGATHFAMALTTYLNQNGSHTIYLEKNAQKAVQKTIKNKKGFTEKDGIFHYKNFSGQPLYGEGIDFEGPREGIRVCDYGSTWEDCALQEELLLLVLGSRPWEVEQSLKAAESLQCDTTIRLVCNYGDYEQARRFARAFRKKVYCFPLDADPFHITREKMEFFTELLQEEGEGLHRKKNYWGSRMRRWDWVYPFIHRIGKLFCV